MEKKPPQARADRGIKIMQHMAMRVEEIRRTMGGTALNFGIVFKKSSLRYSR